MRRRHNPLELLRTTSSLLRQTNNWKATILILLAFAWQAVVGLWPIGLGVWFAVQGAYWPAVWVPIVIYIAYGVYLAFWPIIALFNFIATWIREGFLVALVGTLMLLITMFVLFSAPEWMIYLANRYALRAAKYEEVEKSTFS